LQKRLEKQEKTGFQHTCFLRWSGLKDVWLVSKFTTRFLVYY